MIKKGDVVEKKSTRQGFGQGLLQLGKENKKVVALSADLTESNQMNHFEKAFPERFFQAGVAEQNMVAMSAGLALEGFVPFAATFGVFMMRALDQIRISVCYNRAPVKLVATHCGLSTGEDGATHQALEDVAVLRALPNMTIIEPCDYHQAVLASKAAAQHPGPVYLRLHRNKFPPLTTEATLFQIGRAQILQQGKKLTIIGAGPILNEVIKAAQELKVQRKFLPEIINCPTIKPLDERTILKSVKKTRKVLVIQDHQIYGGLGSAIAELLGEKLPTQIKIMGMADKFGESGKPAELWEKYGLSAQDIYREALKLISDKHLK